MTVGEDGLAINSQMLLRELECDDDGVPKERPVLWYRELAEMVRYLKEENKELCAEVLELKESAARNTSDMLGRAQVVHFETDLRTHRWINALVTERNFPVKKFVSGQKELDNFSGNSSLGMLVMTMLKIEKPTSYHGGMRTRTVFQMQSQTDGQQSPMTSKRWL
jgi:hypothetical protein